MFEYLVPKEPGSATRRFFLSSAIWLFVGILFGFIGALGTRYRGPGFDQQGNTVVDVMTRPDTRALGRAGLFKRLGDVFRKVNAESGTLFDFGFPNGLLYKDVKLCLDEGEALGVPMLVGNAVAQLLAVAKARQGTDADISTIVRCIEEWAGVEVKA